MNGFAQTNNYQEEESDKEKSLIVNIFYAEPSTITIGSPNKSSREMMRQEVTINPSYIKFFKELNSEQFEISLNGKKQKITSFKANNEPISIGILVDTSISVEKRIDEVSFGLAELLTRSNIENEYFLANFSDKIYERVDLTEDSEKLREEIKNLSLIERKARTALFDAVAFGQEKLATAKHKKRVLIVIGDGRNTYSKKSFNDMIKNVERSGILVYSVMIFNQEKWREFESYQGRAYSDEIKRRTGGMSMYPENAEELKDAFREIAEELRIQHTIKLRLDEESYGKLKRTDKGLKIKVKLNQNKVFYINDKGKQKTAKVKVHTRERMFLK